MSRLESDFLEAAELHSAEGIGAALDAGLDPRATVNGKPLIAVLTEMYSRSDKFAGCLRLLLDRGAPPEDAGAIPVLLDDPGAVEAAVAKDPALLARRFAMTSAFTPLAGATLLHIAAEFGHANAARKLIELGADLEARADVDAFGLNGHTPLFHTVNSIGNRCEPVMRLLLEAGARTDARVEGIVWGRGFEWETTFYDLTPIAYAQLGTLPQVHRNETDIDANVRRLLQAAGRKVPPATNVPNRYLIPKKKGG
jgi:hypothetical protein